jgi:UPF0716 protein FxsA
MPWFIAVALLVVPLIEIYVIVQIGQVIGPWWTILLLIVESALGAWLVKREGKRAWQALNSALQTGQMPGRELADGALVLIGGTLLLTPGFVTDVFGFLFVLPFTRPLARRGLSAFVNRRLMQSIGTPVQGFSRRPPRPKTSGKPSGKPGGQPPRTVIVDGEVVETAGPDAVDGPDASRGPGPVQDEPPKPT